MTRSLNAARAALATIAGKILLGCLALTMLTACLGLYTQQAQRQLGSLAANIYDEGFMGLSYLRSAQVEFGVLMQRPTAAGAKDEGLTEVLDDLEVASARAMSARGHQQVEALRDKIRQAEPGRYGDLLPDFDNVVETFSGDGFLYRASVGRFVAAQASTTWWVIGGSTLTALLITLLITRTIAPPIRRAAMIARAIADGRLDNRIVATGRGETADLLRSLGTMQANIAAAMARIHALMEQTKEASEAKLAFMARHDRLTMLPNRVAFEETMSDLLTPSKRPPGLAVLCLDLDRFKTVNDTLGHDAGDAVLSAIASRLQAQVDEQDMLVRSSGNQFIVIQRAIAQPSAAQALTKRLLAAVAEPLMIGDDRLTLTASAGIAVSESPADTAQSLLRSADVALHRAKSELRGTARFFDAEMDLQVQSRRKLETDLRQALAAREFELVYQPLLHAGDGSIEGFEALMRWHRSGHGMTSPAVFIPLAEELGLIAAIGEWAIVQACQEAARWPGTLKVAVNLSPAQFSSPTLLATVRDALDRTGLAPQRLELEITESVLLQDGSDVLETLLCLRGMGVRTSMDDFGTGYSSLSYLWKFPFDKIKIDQSFTRGMSDHSDCLAIIRAVIGLGRTMNIMINAEGVETQAQWDMLRAEGCNQVQGYLFDRPRPASDVLPMLARHGNATLPGQGWTSMATIGATIGTTIGATSG